MKTRRLVIGVTGASGIIYGVRFIQRLRERADTEIHLVMTEAARITLSRECEVNYQELIDQVDVVHNPRNVAASISSGSFRSDGMVVIPCTMNTLAGIAYCHSDNLLVRAADVTLKERRPLILVPRETPLHLGHLRALVAAAEIGAIILPPVPAFYFRPKTIEDLINHTIGKIFDQLGWDHSLFERWGTNGELAPKP
jgi:4-hydroxy-3-polyprenylbenzoate decarboxylase